MFIRKGKSLKSKKGFTLTEVLVTVIIIGVLAAISYPVFSKSIMKARATEAVNLLEIVKNKQIHHYANSSNGTYITDVSKLGKLTNSKEEAAGTTGLKINDKYYLTLNDANSCAYVTYKKGDKDIFTFSTGYETAGLGCSKSAGADSETAEICSSFGDISGSSNSVCAPMPDPWEDRHECTDEQRVKPACDTANGYIDTYQFVETSCSWIGTCTKNPNWCDGQTRACTNDAGRACTQSCTGVSWGACNINCDMSECSEGEEGSFGNCPGICKSDRSGFECKVGAKNENYWCETATSCKPLYKQCLSGTEQRQTCDDGDNYITRTYDLYKGWVGANSEDCNSGFDTANCKCA